MAEPLSDITTPPPDDKARPDLYQTLIVGLLVIVLVVAVGSILLAFFDKPIPDGVLALGPAALVGLTGMLAPRAQ